MTPLIALVVARADNGVIGADGALPWRLPADLRRFKALTLGKPVVMGRRTFESIGRPLPQRRNIVLTRDPAWRADGAEVAHDLAAALALAADGASDVMVIGGGDVYAQALPLAGRIELTEVRAEPAGDARFPPLAAADWRETFREEHPADGDRPAFAFVTLARATANARP